MKSSFKFKIHLIYKEMGSRVHRFLENWRSSNKNRCFAVLSIPNIIFVQLLKEAILQEEARRYMPTEYTRKIVLCTLPNKLRGISWKKEIQTGKNLRWGNDWCDKL